MGIRFSSLIYTNIGVILCSSPFNNLAKTFLIKAKSDNTVQSTLFQVVWILVNPSNSAEYSGKASFWEKGPLLCLWNKNRFMMKIEKEQSSERAAKLGVSSRGVFLVGTLDFRSVWCVLFPVHFITIKWLLHFDQFETKVASIILLLCQLIFIVSC